MKLIFQFSEDFIILKEKHSNEWKVNGKCEVEVNKPNDDQEKLDWAHEKCASILNDSSSTKNSFSNERRSTLYEQCMDETCRFVQ
jgi:hypothetical protein